MVLIILISMVFVSLSPTCGQTTFSCNASAPCGCSSRPAVLSRILNGEIAPNHTWGWATVLILPGPHICGGVLISSSWVLSARSCLDQYRPIDVVVSVGTDAMLYGKQVRRGSRIVRHKEVEWETSLNDVALVMVDPPFNMSDPSTSLICLPSPSAKTPEHPPINSSVNIFSLYRRESALAL